MSGRGRISWTGGAAGALGVVLVLGGCAAVEQRVGGWFGKKPPPPSPASGTTATQKPRVYYAGVDGLEVHNEPSASSTVIGTLSLHEKVTRASVEHGYAHVTSASGLTGWVSNAQLIWRLPTTAAPAPAEAAPEPPEPETPEPTAPAPEPPPTTTTTRTPNPTTSSTIPTRGVPPSIFNPY